MNMEKKKKPERIGSPGDPERARVRKDRTALGPKTRTTAEGRRVLKSQGWGAKIAR